MSVISLNAEQIEQLNQEIVALDNALLTNYLPQLESELYEILRNVQGEEINSIINKILSQYQSVETQLNTDIYKLEQFLEQQIKSYTQTEAELEAELVDVMNRMNKITDGTVVGGLGKTLETVAGVTGGIMGSTASKIFGTTGTKASDKKETKDSDKKETKDSNSELEKRIEKLEKENKELKKSPLEKANDEFLREADADNKEFGKRFTDDWSNVGKGYQDGLVSGVVNTLGATWNTGANAVGWTYNQAANAVEWTLGAIGLGKGTAGDGLMWLLG